jgi:hypothetical protein
MRKDKILSILNGSANRLREKYFIKYHIELYNEIIDYIKLDIPFKQKVWHYINEQPNEILCYCGNKVSFKMNWLDGYKEFCSNKCSSNNINVKNKLKSTLKLKYGVEHFSKTDDFKTKVKQTSIDRYGIDNYSKTEEYITKSKQTYLDRYGVDNYSKTEEYKIKSKKTYLERYGVDNFTKTDEFRKKSKVKNISKFGTKTLFESENYRNKNFDICKSDYYLRYIGDSISLFKCDLGKEHTFEISTDNYYGRKYSKNSLCTICYPISERRSIKESELFEFISKVYNGSIITNYKDYYEIDIYLPDLNLGFEFNGIWWHSDKYKDSNYHINKSKYFEERNIRIIHIWEDDWLYKKEIIKSQILYLLSKSNNRILARKCIIAEIDSKESKNFLNDNHLQGNDKSTIKIGMFYDNELVSVMTFDRFEGRKKMEEDGWNLSRFSVKLNTVVVGGASKLLSYFIKKHKPLRIVSYADLSWSNGNLYSKLGFEVKYITKPDYKYILNGKRIHKSNFKKKLTKTLLTESEYAKSKELYKIYDCGKIKFEKVNK